MKDPLKLSPKHQKFVDEYFLDLNATKAYVRAGYKEKGAEQNAARMMRNDKVRAAIEAKRRRLEDKADLSVVWVLQRLGREAILEGSGSTQMGRIKALELLGKHLGLFSDKHEMIGANGGPIVFKHLADKSMEELRAIDANLNALAADRAGRTGPGPDCKPS